MLVFLLFGPETFISFQTLNHFVKIIEKLFSYVITNQYLKALKIYFNNQDIRSTGSKKDKYDRSYAVWSMQCYPHIQIYRQSIAIL